MFATETPVGEVILSIERLLEKIRTNLGAKGGSMQLHPTGSFGMSVGGSSIGTVVSLDVMQQGSNWHAAAEHWFRNANVDFAQAFGTHGTLGITPQIVCGTTSPCTPLASLMTTLAQSWAANFQMYALGVLQQSDWTQVRPTLGTRLFSFDAGGTDKKRPRVVFDVDANDGTKLNHIVWLTDDNTLSAFPVQTLTLPFQGSSLPTAKYYYCASR